MYYNHGPKRKEYRAIVIAKSTAAFKKCPF
jgi:hypothetical protein